MITQCAIVDDKINDIQIIQNTISSICYGTDLLLQFHQFNRPLDLDISKPFDIYVLDIDMPDINGFKLAEKIRDVHPRAVIIFCTLHDNLVFDSLQLDAFYFVRKNHLQDDFTYALRKYTSSTHEIDFYIAKTAEGLKKIYINDIMYFEVVHNDIYIHLIDEKEIKERKSLQTIKSEFNGQRFIQIGKSFIVNMLHISSIKKYTAVLSNDQIIEIPKAQYTSVAKAFLMYSSR